MPSTHLGSDQWFCSLVKDHVDNGVDRKSAIQQILPLYFHLHQHIDLTVTESTLAEDIVHKQYDE